MVAKAWLALYYSTLWFVVASFGSFGSRNGKPDEPVGIALGWVFGASGRFATDDDGDDKHDLLFCKQN